MLHVEDFNAYYGPQPVVFGLSFSVDAGEAVVLLGRNGMGKTATLKGVLGLIDASANTLSFDGRLLQGLSAHRRARLGIGYAAQEARVFPELTVLENLKLGGGRDAGLLERLLDTFPQLRGRLAQVAGTLSGGEQQMLGVVRGLWSQPRLLLLDEPGEGLMPAMLDALGPLLRKYCDDGGALLMSEQHVQWARAWCDRGLLLERGRLVWAETMAALSDEVVRRHLGVF